MARRTLKLPATYELAVSPRQTYVAAIGRNVVLADLKVRKRLASWHPFSHPSHIAFNGDESRIAVKNTSGEIVVLRIPDGSVAARHVPSGSDEGATLHFSDCGDYIVDGSWAGAIRVWAAHDLHLVSEFTFPKEMIQKVSCSADGKLWLFVHQPIIREGENFTPPPYLTIWEWPLKQPLATLFSNMDILYGAAVSPCASFISTLGHVRSTRSTTLCLRTIAGNAVCSTHLSNGTSVKELRWAPNSRAIGVVSYAGFTIYDVPQLILRTTIDAKYPSDLAFIEENTCAILGTLDSGTIVPLDLRRL